MNHAANLGLSGTYCGAELGDHDRKLAAFLPDTMAMLDCPTCRRGLGLPVAWMRVHGIQETPLHFVALKDTDTICVVVPALGYLMVRQAGDVWAAIRVSGEDEDPSPRTVTVLDDGRLCIPMLRKADRLDVLIELAAA